MANIEDFFIVWEIFGSEMPNVVSPLLETCIPSQKFDVEWENINGELSTEAVPAEFSALRGRKDRFSNDLACR